MSEYTLNDDGLDDGGDEIAATKFTGREGTIYLIDAAKFVNDPEKSIVENEDQFRLCLECIEADMLKNILINAKDLVSVVFYNTLHSPPSKAPSAESEDVSQALGRDNCAVFIPLSPLSTELVRYFKNFRESLDFFDFKTTHGSTNESHFKDALWLCSRLLIRCNYKLIFSKIVLFTNNELPHTDRDAEHQAFVHAKDLYDNNINVELVPMVDEFDFEHFYKDFLSTVSGEDSDSFQPFNPIDKKTSLLNRTFQSDDYRRACLRHLKFELSDGVAMSCDVYSLSRAARKPNSIKVFREDRTKVVVTKRSYYILGQSPADVTDVDDPEQAVPARAIPPGEQFKCQNICGREIIFKPGEIVQMKSLQSPGLRLLGFKPMTTLKSRWMIKHSLFLYPNEKSIEGSTTLFRSMWHKCLEKQVYVLCALTARRGMAPKYVALVAQQAQDHGNDGFRIIQLPMETNIGVLDSIVSELPEPTVEEHDLMKRISKKVRFQYDPETFSNPTLQSFYKTLEALIYEEEEQPSDDFTLPDVDAQDAKIEPFLEDILAEFGSEPASSGSRGKRANENGDAGTARAKAPKKDLTMAEIELALKNDQTAAVTVPHLKDFIKSKNAKAPADKTKAGLFAFAQKLID